MTKRDRLAFRWLVAAGILLVAGVLAFGYAAIASAFNSTLPHDRALEVGLRDAAGKSIIFIAFGIGVLFIPSAVCALVAALLANGV